MEIEAPQSFIVREECEKAAWQKGFRRFLDEEAGWRAFTSTTAQGTIYLAAGDALGPWYLALDNQGIIRELRLTPIAAPGPGQERFVFNSLRELYDALGRVYELGVSLPDAPLLEFVALTEFLPRETEAERLIIQRVGQNVFRDRLLDYWQGRCPLTGISDQALLRASHIIPWSECGSDAERLNVHNGLLLSALWDAAFDRVLVTFNDDGCPEFASHLSPSARDALFWISPLPLTDMHRERLALHRLRLNRA